MKTIEIEENGLHILFRVKSGNGNNDQVPEKNPQAECG